MNINGGYYQNPGHHPAVRPNGGGAVFSPFVSQSPGPAPRNGGGPVFTQAAPPAVYQPQTQPQVYQQQLYQPQQYNQQPNVAPGIRDFSQYQSNGEGAALLQAIVTFLAVYFAVPIFRWAQAQYRAHKSA
jgi:hypothetical protein